jgi:hypothetical protein
MAFRTGVLQVLRMNAGSRARRRQDIVFRVAVVAFRKAVLGRTVSMTVRLVMAFVAVDLLHGLSLKVLLISRSNVTIQAAQLSTMHRVLVRLHGYTKPALPACFVMAPHAVRHLIEGR